jgi:putative glutamine amidotransferase
MGRPIIGLTTYGEQTKFGSNDTFSAVLPMAYVHAVHVSGGRAVLVTQDDPDPDVLNDLDGLIITGGADVDPERYGEIPHPRTVSRPDRDAAEFMLLRAALEADLPTLGICRGMQLMAVAYGGRLFQHLPDVLGHDGHRPHSGPKFGTHPVRFAPGSMCASILGTTTIVNSFHHQGVADPGSLTAVGWVPDEIPRQPGEAGAVAGDGAAPGLQLIEALEAPSRRFAIGVQWHPEDTDDFRLFEALVAAAAETAEMRRGRVLPSPLRADLGAPEPAVE